MKRSTLDALARDHHLDEAAIAAALDLTASRPDAAAWRLFAIRLLAGTGIAALGAGAIFFIAANWHLLEVVGRFVLMELAFVACVAAALWRPPPARLGSAALVLAMLLVGGLLALFGQSYQTGADLYELFVAWALLAIPFALAGASGAPWAIWWIVANIAMGLVFGWLGQDNVLWRLVDRWSGDRPAMLMVPCALNLAGAVLWTWLAGTRFAAHAPRWLARLLATFGFAYGTIASIAAIVPGTPEPAVVMVFAAVSIAVAGAALHARKDVFPMALVIASWIAISTAFLVVQMRTQDLGTLFVVAVWLVGTSTAAGFVLMKWVRAWRIDEETQEAAA